MKFKRAELSDAEEITELRKNSLTKNELEKYPLGYLNYLLSINNLENIKKKIAEKEMFCLVDNDEIIGTVALVENEVSSVFVKYNQIRKGVGRKLMYFIESFAKEKGINLLKVCSAEKAKGFYEKIGFTQVKVLESEINGAKKINFEMEKKL